MHPTVSQQSILCPEWPSPWERTHLKHGIDVFLWLQRQGNLIYLVSLKRGKFWGYIRPKTRKHDLNQNNVGPKRGKPDFVWPKTGKSAGHIRAQTVKHGFHENNVGSKRRRSNIVRPKTRKLLKAEKLAGHIRPKTGKHDFDQNQENHKNLGLFPRAHWGRGLMVLLILNPPAIFSLSPSLCMVWNATRNRKEVRCL